MKDVDIQVICDKGFTHVYNEPVEDWVNWITVDADGDVGAWELKPKSDSMFAEWLHDKVGEYDQLTKLGSCGYSDWKGHIFYLETEKLPYEGKKSFWIRDVRHATGASLLLSKFAVDCALESGLKGSHEDFRSSVRFLIDVTEQFSIPLTGNADFETRFRKAVTVLENGFEKETISSFTLNYWKGEDND
jgi:hypothetical protein